MQLDHLLRGYFGTADLSAVPLAALSAGTERIAVDFGLERDRSRRFALWVLRYVLGAAPDLDVAFEDRADRNAARTFMELGESRDGR